MKSITQAKFMLKNKSELLRKENKGLLAKRFMSRCHETVKAHKQSKELLASAGFKNGASGKQHFWEDPSPSKQHCGEGERVEGGKVLTKTTESNQPK